MISRNGTTAFARVACAAVLLVSAVCVTMPSLHAAPAPQDDSTIKQLVANFATAFNSHDAHAVTQLFTTDVYYTNVGGATTHGRKGVEDYLTPLFAGRLRTLMVTPTVRDIQMVTPNVAIVTSDVSFGGMKGPGGADMPPRKAYYDWVVRKEGGQWMIASFHESFLPEAPGPQLVK